MVGEKSLSKLRTACWYGSLVLLVATILFIGVSMLCLVNIWYCTDPTYCLPMMDHIQTCVAAVSYLLTSVFIAVVCALAHGIMGRMGANDTPFTQGNVRRMRLITGVSLLAFLLSLAAQFLILLAMRSPVIWVEFPMEFLVIAALTYIFSLLFEYGTALQTESDHFL